MTDSQARRGRARHQRRDGIELRTGVLEIVDPERDEIRGLARLQAADVVTSKDCRATAGRELERDCRAENAPPDGSPPRSPIRCTSIACRASPSM